MTLYVDGYNLIFAASRRMSGFDIANTEAARDNLLGLLAKYRSARSEHVMVFFDGGPDAGHMPRRAMVRGIDVVFSDARSDADTDIKNAVSHSDAPRDIRVITSDAAIRNFVRRYGATVTESAEFLKEVDETLKENSLPSDEPIEKYGGATDADVDYWLKIFGKDEEGGE